MKQEVGVWFAEMYTKNLTKLVPHVNQLYLEVGTQLNQTDAVPCCWLPIYSHAERTTTDQATCVPPRVSTTSFMQPSAMYAGDGKKSFLL